MPRRLVLRDSTPRETAERRTATVRLLIGEAHYDELICRELPSARVSLWIATANLKDLRVEAPIGTRARARGKMMSVVETLSALAARGVDVKILHGRPPSGPFQQSLRQLLRPSLGAPSPRSLRTLGDARAARQNSRQGFFGATTTRFELRECPRVHMKAIAIDGRTLYLGSANFTGAGLGARAAQRRNFEIGIVTDDEYLLDAVQREFHEIWSGRRCASCRLRSECPRPIDLLESNASTSRAAVGSARPRAAE